MKVTEILEKIQAAKQNLEFLPTGFKELDFALDGGFMRDELIVIGGFTGLGKSYLAGQILYNIAREGYKTSYMSLEITNSMIVSRLIGQEANVKSIKVLTGSLDTKERDEVLKAEGVMQGYEELMDFEDNKYLIADILKNIKEGNYDFIVVDFIQNIITQHKDEYSRLSAIALELQKIAKEKHCCILVLSQLSNEVAKRGDGSLLEYKGSGSIATVCDLGFFITRTTDEFEDVLTLILKKNRRGSSGLKLEFRFQKEGGKII